MKRKVLMKVKKERDMKKRIKNAVTELQTEYCGQSIGEEELKEVAEKYVVDFEKLGNAFLQEGIDEGWLFDEYFYGTL